MTTNHHEVAALAHSNLIKQLGRYNNNVGPKHSDALRLMLNEMAAMAFGERSGRRAYPLGCGLGKTQGIVALCAALHALDSGRSVAISASKVESLCGVKRDMIAAGITVEYEQCSDRLIGGHETSSIERAQLEGARQAAMAIIGHALQRLAGTPTKEPFWRGDLLLLSTHIPKAA